MEDKINIIWIKKDVRTQDHRPFWEAEKAKEDYIAIYLIEPTVSFIHKPWALTPMEITLYGIKEDYPAPIVNLKSSGKQARDKIWRHKKPKEVKANISKILELHTRNNDHRRKQH